MKRQSDTPGQWLLGCWSVILLIVVIMALLVRAYK